MDCLVRNLKVFPERKGNVLYHVELVTLDAHPAVVVVEPIEYNPVEGEPYVVITLFVVKWLVSLHVFELDVQVDGRRSIDDELVVFLVFLGGDGVEWVLCFGT